MDEAMLIWGLVLLAACAALLLIELFVPSGGMIAAASGVAGIAGVVLLFRVSGTWGVIGTSTLVVLYPSAFAAWVKLFPNTYFGRKMMGELPPEQVRAIEDREHEVEEELRSLLGREGTALTDLYPVGYIEIDGQRRDALCDGRMIEKGEKIVVSSIQNQQVHVRSLG